MAVRSTIKPEAEICVVINDAVHDPKRSECNTKIRKNPDHQGYDAAHKAIAIITTSPIPFIQT